MNKEQLNQLIELLVILRQDEWKEFSKYVKEMEPLGRYLFPLSEKVNIYSGLWNAMDLLLRFLHAKQGDNCNHSCNLNSTLENEKKAMKNGSTTPIGNGFLKYDLT